MYEEKTEQLRSENHALKAELALYQAGCEHYTEAYDSLKAQIMELRRHRFGKRSERYIDPENPKLSLFEDNQAIFSQTEAAGELIKETTRCCAYQKEK